MKDYILQFRKNSLGRQMGYVLLITETSSNEKTSPICQLNTRPLGILHLYFYSHEFSQRNYERRNIPKAEVSEEQINYMKRANRQMTKYLDKYEIDDVLEEGEKENTILFNPKWYSDFQKSMLLEKCVTLLSN